MKNVQFQIRKINPDILAWGEKCIEDLSDILMDDESIIHIIDGSYNNKSTAILLSTEKRLIFKGIGVDLIEVIPHENVKLLQFIKESRKISIHTDDQIFGIETIEEALTIQFYETVYRAIFGLSKVDPVENTVSSESIFILLEKLGNLRQNGILTEEEFSVQKKKLLESL